MEKQANSKTGTPVNKPTRCINIDWLEIYALEPPDEPHTPDYYRSKNLQVEEREYGTRIYKQMFKIQDSEGHDLLEVRRDPKQAGMQNAILPINACHIRLSNRTCYADNAVEILRSFCQAYNILFVNIFRIDICLDFDKFDSGDNPKDFLMRYIKRKYSKVNQSDAHGHFNDRWDGRDWNSVSWGSKKSAIGTKMYNKTKELKEVGDKPYIRQAWFESHLVDDPQHLYKINSDGTTYTPVIWRVEFSIRSQVRNWLTYEKDGDPKQKRSVRNTLEMYDTKPKLLVMFALLQDHYFHFRHYRKDKLKYDCPRKILFKFKPTDQFYSVEHPSSQMKPDTLEQRLLKLLKQYRLIQAPIDIIPSILAIEQKLETSDLRRLLVNPYSEAQLFALQQAIAARMEGSKEDPQELITRLVKLASEDPKLF